MCDALRKGISQYTEETENWNAMREEFYTASRYHLDPEEESRRCVCGQYPIREICEIVHRKTKVRLELGNSCINQFCEEINVKPLCPECDIYEMEKTTHNKCDNCRRERTRPTGIVKLKKFKGSTYDWVWNKDPMYCMWMLDNVPGYDKHFTDFCKRRYWEEFGMDYKMSLKGVNNFLVLRSRVLRC
jgi:hypothetical protein